ncbi:MAG: hypothetical protein EXS25_11280 [Pedosphaera sp.]|nr:hypothetical protein [Pedosphaera sp.]
MEQSVVAEITVQKTMIIDEQPSIFPEDIEDPVSLVETFLEPDDEVARMVRGRLSIQLRSHLADWRSNRKREVDPQLLELLATDLTRIVLGEELLIDTDLLQRISLSTVARRRLEGIVSRHIPSKEGAPLLIESADRAQANRWLLNDFFPLTEKRQRIEYTVAGNDEFLPQLRISKSYKDLLSEAETSPEVREYIRDKIKAGKFLIKSLNQRQSTILGIGREIVKRQREFFEKGVEYLRPLTMDQVAAVVGVHETTVSRAVSGKYISTPQGLFELRYFFTSGVATSDGLTVSNTSVKNILLDLVSGENRSNPLSDDVLVAKLKEKGIILARRTVAKYRAELNVLPSHLRRDY